MRTHTNCNWMHAATFSSFVIALLALAHPFPIYAQEDEAEIGITVDLAAKLINLSGAVQSADFHTDIRFSSVDCSTVLLTLMSDQPGSLPVNICRRDGRGFLIAQFLIEDIAELDPVIGEMNTFILHGKTHEEVRFAGSQDILVVDRSEGDDDDDDNDGPGRGPQR